MIRREALSAEVSLRSSTWFWEVLLLLRCVKLSIDFGRVLAGMMGKVGRREFYSRLVWEGFGTAAGCRPGNE